MSSTRQEYQLELDMRQNSWTASNFGFPLRCPERVNLPHIDFQPERFLFNPILLAVCLKQRAPSNRADDPETGQLPWERQTWAADGRKASHLVNLRWPKAEPGGSCGDAWLREHRKGRSKTALVKQGKSSAFTRITVVLKGKGKGVR